MRTEKIASKHFDSLREDIITLCDGEIEVLVYGRRDGNITVDLGSGHSLSGEASKAIADAISRHFDGQSERVRLRTQFSLVAYRDLAGIFLEYKMEDFLLEFERATLEVPRHIMGLVQFLECMEGAEVEFRFGYNRSDQFVLSQHVNFAGCELVTQGSLKSKESHDFIIGVGGEYLKRIMNNPTPLANGCLHVVNLVLEEEDGIVYFRLYHKGQRFFSVERDKLRSKK